MIKSIDHFVLTTEKLDECIAFYTQVLGMELERYGNERLALKFGTHKINIHQPGVNANLKAQHPRAGSLDFCFLADCALEQVIETLKRHNVAIIEGPSIRTGARWPIRSVYVRDPDQNLVEISERAF